MKSIFFTVCGILLLLFGCGSDETSELIEVMPNYFPDAVGSRWVYLYSDGIQGATEVNDEINLLLNIHTPRMGLMARIIEPSRKHHQMRKLISTC